MSKITDDKVKSSKEIALDFSEEFQNNYPKKPLFDMMDRLAKEIDTALLASRERVVELENILASEGIIIGDKNDLPHGGEESVALTPHR
jgi:hypothetical protein